MRLFARLVRFSAWGLVGILALALGAVAVLTMTERGRSNLASIVSWAISGPDAQIALTGIDGLLNGRLRAESLVLADAEGPWLALRDVEVDWSPLALLGFTFDAERVAARRVELARLPKRSSSTESSGLPVQIRIQRFEFPDVALGEALAGTVASLAAQGSVRIEGNPLAVSGQIDARRTDGIEGTLSAKAAYLPQDNRIELQVDGREPAGGILATLLALPGKPAIAVTASGSGPASDWDGRAEMALDGQVVTRLTGRHQFIDAGSRVELEGQGRFALFLPTGIAPLAEGNTSFSATATIGTEGRTEVAAAALQSAAVDARASGVIDPTGSNDFRLSATARQGAAPVQLDMLTATLKSAELTVTGPGSAARVSANMELPAVSLPDYQAENVAMSIGSTAFDLPTLSGNLTFTATAEAAGSANATVAGLLAGKIELTGDMQIAEQTITFAAKNVRSGTASATVSGRYDRQSGAVEADVAAELRSVVLPAAARMVLADAVTLTGRVTRTADAGLALTALDLKSGPLALAGEAALAGGNVDAKFAGTLADLSRLSPRASGAASFSLTANGETTHPRVEAKVQSAAMKVADRDIRDVTLLARLLADPASPSGEFSVTGKVGSEELAGGASLVASAEGSELRELSLALGANRIEGALSLDRQLRPQGEVAYTLPDIAPLAALGLLEASGAARGSARFYVDDGRANVMVDALVDHLAAFGIEAGEVRLNASLQDYLGSPGVSGAVSAGRVIRDTTEFREFSVALTQDGGWTGFDGSLVLNGMPIKAKGRAAYAGGAATIELASAGVELRGTPARLGAPTTLIVRDGAVSLNQLIVSASGGRATISGSAGAQLNLDVALASLPASAINAFAAGLDARGTLSGTVRVTGPAAAPAVSFDARLAEGAVAQTRAAGFGAMDVRSSGTYAGNTLRFTARVGDGSGLGMDGGGTINIAARTASLDFSGSVPFGFLTHRLAAQGVALSGTASVSIAVRGNLFSPDLSGRVSTSGARFVHAASGLAVDDLAADIALAGGTATISSMTGRLSTGGSITGSGSVGIDPSKGFPADLSISVGDGRYTDGRVVTSSFSGDIKVTGPLVADPLLAGNVSLGRTVITVPERIGGASAGSLDVQHRNAPASVVRQDAALRPANGGGEGGSGLALDLNIQAPQQIFIVGRGLDAELGGNLRLTGPIASPQAVGQFTMRRGRLSLLGRRLEFTSGTVGFSGSMVPYLNLVATTQAEGATVTVTVTGPATDPTFSFASTPSLPEDEVMARLVFGKAMGSLSPLQIAQLAAAVGQLAGIGGSTSFLENLREQIGVDDIDVRTDEKTGDTSLSVGKYLNDRTYLTLEKGTQPGSGKATIDLNVGGGLKLRGQASDDGKAKGGIFYEREY